MTGYSDVLVRLNNELQLGMTWLSNQHKAPNPCSGAVVFPAWLLSCTCSQTRKPQYFNLHHLEQLVSSWPVKHGVLQGPSLCRSSVRLWQQGQVENRVAVQHSPSGSERIFIILRHSWAVKLYSTNNTTQLFARSSSPPQFHRVLPLAENTCDIFTCKMLLDKLPVYLPPLFYPNKTSYGLPDHCF